MTMTIGRDRIAALLAIALLSACGTGAAGDASGDGGGGDGSDDGGGGVGLGGAQDIGAFRAILEAGEIPGEDTLDANGFFSEHYSELPDADCGDPLCLVGMIAVGRDWVMPEDHAILQVSLSTPIDPSGLERKPLNLVVVIDTSGSMSVDDRIGFAREGLHALIDELREGDRLALVTYSDSVTVRATLAEPADKATLHAIADELVAAGGTNLHDGLETGFQLGLESYDVERQNRILLVSDGLANVGISDDASIQAMADSFLSDGIGLTTVGVGLDFNVALMRGLAERGAGNFYFLEDAAAIAEVFREELDYFVTPLALDVQLEVAAETSWELGEVVGTHYWNGSSRSGGVALPAVFVASRESDEPGEFGRRGAGGAIFVSMLPGAFSVWEPSEALATLRLSYRLPGEEERREASILVDSRPDIGSSEDDVYLGNEAMAEHYSMYAMFHGLRDATRFAGAGAYDCALSALERLDARAASWQSEFADEDIEADRAIVAQFQGNLREAGARPVDGSFESACSEYTGGYDDEEWNDDGSYEDDVREERDLPYCQAGGSARAGAASWTLIGLAMLAVRRRRRGAGAGAARGAW